MTIRIIPHPPLEKRDSLLNQETPLLLFPQLKPLYQRRTARLRHLAERNPLGDYLRFAAVITTAQEIVLYDHPLHFNIVEQLTDSAARQKPPLDITTLARSDHWQRLLHSLIAELKPEMSGQALAVLENLEKSSASELEIMAESLLKHEFAQVSSDKSPFIWAALSLYWAQMAALIPGKVRIEQGEHRQFCPVCGSLPVSGIIPLGGKQDETRYLHCNLCECEWLVDEGKCSNCEEESELHLWSLEGEQSAVKAESCGVCGTYLKLLWQARDPAIEPVADDLASLLLDARMEQESFSRSSLNPFMFPGDS
ncbi:formate dehydrogenase accessory protein FdhE [Pantoea sp. A4]|uniref:formate dehydrogenase accessory protein FdhE n=1 Tax=Pantoea sp. A4 TaxID=1225184 RepID=UPI00035D84D4|nr:formate dehydrogenase accessory protein FdhE [Pantoea sp. A4]